MLWTLKASYFYYAHGPLARIETGQHNIQGTDYFYTLQGWIKGVNSIGLTYTWQDPGKDAAGQSTFNKDEYAYALNYYEGDYEARIGNGLLGKCFWFNEMYNNQFSGYKDAVGGVEYNRESLYNGNIAAMATSIRHFGELQSTQSMNYRYDQLHRIAAAHASKWEGIWTTVEGSYNTSYAYDGNGNIQNLYRNNLEATTIDELYYHYDPVKKNRLDVVKDGGTAEGLNNANPYEYKYDQIGNLTQNLEDGIEDIKWNIYGKVEKVSKTNGTLISYRYDGTGNRILKEVRTTTTVHTNLYLRDASGNVMAIYEDTKPINSPTTNITLKEIPIYGSSRLGQYRPKTDAKKTALGQRIYEFSNHLGNVLVTLTDNKVPQTDGTYESVVVSASDYYPFGMAMSERTYSNSEYRYGFNGKEKDWDIAVGKTDFGARIYDELTGRWFSLDQYTKPHQSDYVFATDNPIIFIDPDGRDDFYFDKQARTWHIIPTGAPHRFITFINISDGEGGTIESIRPMTDSEVGAALYRNNELYVRAMQSAYTPENAGRLRYLRAEYFGLTSVNLSHKKARPIIYMIGGLIVLPIAAEVIGEAALAEFLFEETVEYGLESAGVPVPIFNDPTDIVEYAFKKGSKKTIQESGEITLEHTVGAMKRGSLKGNVSTGAGRDHVTYRGIKNGQPYTGYASAPSSENLSPEEIISRRYGGNFDEFGGTPPTAAYSGSGVEGKKTARGLEQHYFEEDGGLDKTSNKQNPVGSNNGKKSLYEKAKNIFLKKIK